VIAHDLLELVASPVQPVGEALVELRAKLLSDPVIGGVADQHVPEAEHVLDRLVRADELLSHEPREVRAARATALRPERSECLPFELEADDGSALQQRALVLGEGVEASGEERVQREWHPLGVAPLGDHCQHLFDVEGISLGHLPHSSAALVRDPRVAEELPDQLVGLLP